MMTHSNAQKEFLSILCRNQKEAILMFSFEVRMTVIKRTGNDVATIKISLYNTVVFFHQKLFPTTKNLLKKIFSYVYVVFKFFGQNVMQVMCVL
jgi:hypothetical protein